MCIEVLFYGAGTTIVHWFCNRVMGGKSSKEISESKTRSKKTSSRSSKRVKLVDTSKQNKGKLKTLKENTEISYSGFHTATNRYCSGESVPPIYRKKSSCPSCDYRDIHDDDETRRKRSDSSLRYSDFKKVLSRQSKILGWDTKPADIPLFGVPPVN